jgi:hypothetical protein
MPLASTTAYTTRPLDAGTWSAFAELVEANNGVWGGCWCMGFHPEGLAKDATPSQNREAELRHVRKGTVHQVLVFEGEKCVGWCQYGSPAELPNIKNLKAYGQELGELPAWRSPPSWPRSRRPAAGWSRPTPSRSKVESRGAAPTSTLAPRPCSWISDSSVIDGSPSGVGS